LNTVSNQTTYEWRIGRIEGYILIPLNKKRGI